VAVVEEEELLGLHVLGPQFRRRPDFFNVDTTSNSIRHSSMSFWLCPSRVSGGTSVECITTSVRSRFIAVAS